jgi:DNA topoisomerase I
MGTTVERLKSCEVNASGAGVLCYATDELPGYKRERHRRSFLYFDAGGRRIVDPLLLERFQALAIPPAWTDVWICPTPDGHLQATGRDVRGRKQYIYNLLWKDMRSLTKFERMLPFGSALPVIRGRIEDDLHQKPLSREAVLAFAVRLLEETLVRIGNREYARQNQSFGLTTLRHYHVSISGTLIHLEFKGKGGKEWQVDLRDRALARLARKYQELPGQQLLQYKDQAGRLQMIESADVNSYLRRISGEDFTAKDFRTWGATVNAAVELYHMGRPGSETEGKRKIAQAIKKTGRKLGNTPSICRKYYIHPKVIDAFWDESLFRLMAAADDAGASEQKLTSEERAVLELLSAREIGR